MSRNGCICLVTGSLGCVMSTARLLPPPHAPPAASAQAEQDDDCSTGCRLHCYIRDAVMPCQASCHALPADVTSDDSDIVVTMSHRGGALEAPRGVLQPGGRVPSIVQVRCRGLITIMHGLFILGPILLDPSCWVPGQVRAHCLRESSGLSQGRHLRALVLRPDPAPEF